MDEELEAFGSVSYWLGIVLGAGLTTATIAFSGEVLVGVFSTLFAFFILCYKIYSVKKKFDGQT